MAVDHSMDEAAREGNTSALQSVGGGNPIVKSVEGEIPVVKLVEGETPVVKSKEGETPVSKNVEGETPSLYIEGEPHLILRGRPLLFSLRGDPNCV